MHSRRLFLSEKSTMNKETEKKPASFKRNQKVEVRGMDGEMYNVRILGKKKPKKMTVKEQHEYDLSVLKAEYEAQIDSLKSHHDWELRSVRATVRDKETALASERNLTDRQSKEIGLLKDKVDRREKLLLDALEVARVTDVGCHSSAIKAIGQIEGMIAARAGEMAHRSVMSYWKNSRNNDSADALAMGFTDKIQPR